MGSGAWKAERELPSTCAAKAAFMLEPDFYGADQVSGRPWFFQQWIELIGNFVPSPIATNRPVRNVLIFMDYPRIVLGGLSLVGDTWASDRAGPLCCQWIPMSPNSD